MNIFLIGFFFICTLGTILHFTYEWSKHNKFVALFSAVNESTWEHIKMILTAFFLWTAIDMFFIGTLPNYWISKLVTLAIMISVVPLIFYGYTIITKKPILIIDILSFYIDIALAQFIGYIVINESSVSLLISNIALLLVALNFGFYMVGTLLPVESFFFKDPISKKYGVDGHTDIEQIREYNKKH